MKTFCVALSSRTVDRLALILVADPGAAKTRIIRVVIANFPAVLELTSGSSKSLNYLSEEQVVNTILWISETTGAKDLAPDLRCLLSEGFVARSVTVKDPKTNKNRTDIQRTNWQPTFISTQNQTLTTETATANRILYENVDQSETQIEGALRWIARRDRRPHFEDPRLDPQLNKYVIETFDGSDEVTIPYLEPIVERLPKKKTLIFRRFDQLRYLIKLIGRIYRQQRIHCLVDGQECIIANPIDFHYATDILGPGAMAGIRDARLDMIYEKMKSDTIYETKEIGDLMDRTPSWLYPRLTALEQEGRIERLEQIGRSFRFRRIENVPSEDPLQAKYLEGYEDYGPLFNQWVAEVDATIVYQPKRPPVYYDPLSFSDASEPQTALNNAKSAQPTRTLSYSAIIEPRSITNNRVQPDDLQA